MLITVDLTSVIVQAPPPSWEIHSSPSKLCQTVKIRACHWAFVVIIYKMPQSFFFDASGRKIQMSVFYTYQHVCRTKHSLLLYWHMRTPQVTDEPILIQTFISIYLLSQSIRNTLEQVRQSGKHVTHLVCVNVKLHTSLFPQRELCTKSPMAMLQLSNSIKLVLVW